MTTRVTFSSAPEAARRSSSARRSAGPSALVEDASGERTGERLGLLVDLLDEEVREAALLRRFGIPIHVNLVAADRDAVEGR